MQTKATLNHLSRHLKTESRIVMRADFNVPLKDGKIKDSNRIQMTVPTIAELLKHKPKSIVLLSHLGRPNGQSNPSLSLRPIAQQLSSLLSRKVTFLQDCVGDSVKAAVAKAQGDIFLCENVRFHQQEEGSIKGKDGKKIKTKPQLIEQFRKQLSQLGECYVNDAFGTAHRAHSSVVGLKHKHRVAGLLMEKELSFLGNFLAAPRKPVLAILGGSKVSDKIELILNMMKLANDIIIAGQMSFPFLRKMHDLKLGTSSVEEGLDSTLIDRIISAAQEKGVRLHFPIDAICAQKIAADIPFKTCDNKDVPSDMMVLDVGPKSAFAFEKIVKNANSIFWNGPVGVFEIKQFENGSVALLQNIANQTKKGAVSIIGGGDTARLVNDKGMSQKVTFVSTGGGATLEFMQGLELPGVKNLSDIQDFN